MKLLEDRDSFFPAVPSGPCPEQSSLNAGALLLEGRKASLITWGEVWQEETPEKKQPNNRGV